jgi:[acyl-carrier-protein] S-malonyltransferase
MGKETHDAFSCARDVFVAADAALEFGITDLCFSGPEDALKLTRNTQPAILTTSIAIVRVLQERGFSPDYVAGHSLGEYSALVCAGALDFADAVRVVRKRGTYMQEAVPPGEGAMAAVIGLDPSMVRAACESVAGDGVVSPANFNSPEQTVIAGESEAVQRASERARELGAKRVIPLVVSAPFHCALMAAARDRLAADLRDIHFLDPKVPVISNVDAHEVRSGDAARDALIRQVCAPVQWVNSVRFLADRGVDRFVEIGPGKVLTGLVRKIAPDVQTLNVEGIRGIEALASGSAGATM